MTLQGEEWPPRIEMPIAWVCGAASVPKGMTVAAKNTGTLSSRHMPVECRY